MRRHATLLVVFALVLAGCVGGQGATGTTAVPNDAETTVEATTAAGGETNTASSGMNFYVSDEQNAMGDFAHLNVTISKVGVKSAGGDGNWTTHDVDNRTVDLTRLAGANATRLATFPVSNGTYDTVFVHVSEVNGTLTNGEHVRVKLPSEKLQIHQTFTIGPNESVDYVFDISVFKAGKSGKYILKPVISESGTEQEIEVVGDENGEDDEREEDERNETEDGDENETEVEERNETEGEEQNETEVEEQNDTESDDLAAVNATFVGNVTRGENATVSVTRNGSAVANATISVDGEVVGETGTDGTLTVSVPNRDEFEVEIETDRGSAKLKRHFQKEDGDSANGEEG